MSNPQVDIGGEEVVDVRRPGFRRRHTMSALPLKIIEVEVKGKGERWSQYTASLMQKKGGMSLDYGNLGDKFAVSLLLQSVNDISVERAGGGTAIAKISQGNDPRHHKVTTFRFDSYDAARKFQSTLLDFQRKEREGTLGRGRSLSRSSGSLTGQPSIRRKPSTEEVREIRELKAKFFQTNKKTASKDPNKVCAFFE